MGKYVDMEPLALTSDNIKSRYEKLLMIDNVYDIIMTIENDVSKKYLLIYYHEILSVLRIMKWQWNLDSVNIVEDHIWNIGYSSMKVILYSNIPRSLIILI